MAEARRHGVRDAKREHALGHFDHSDPDSLAELDWDHQAEPALRQMHAELRKTEVAPELAAWEEVVDGVRAAYRDAFAAAAPQPEDKDEDDGEGDGADEE